MADGLWHETGEESKWDVQRIVSCVMGNDQHGSYMFENAQPRRDRRGYSKQEDSADQCAGICGPIFSRITCRICLAKRFETSSFCNTWPDSYTV